MNNIEHELAAAMHEQATKLAPRRDVLGAATLRHRRRTVARRTAYATGVLALAGVLTTVGLWRAEQGRGVDPPTTVVAPQPELALAAAVASSESTSYRIRITDTFGGGQAWTREGALDPVRASGYLRSPFNDGSGRYYEDRLVDGTWYIGGTDDASTFKQMPGRRERLDFNDSLHGLAGASSDPNDLLRALRESRATITQPSPDVYHFELVLVDEPAVHEKVTVAGDVRLNPDGRIASVTYETLTKARKGSTPVEFRMTTAIEMYDYGATVTVHRPPNVVVVP